MFDISLGIVKVSIDRDDIYSRLVVIYSHLADTVLLDKGMISIPPET